MKSYIILFYFFIGALLVPTLNSCKESKPYYDASSHQGADTNVENTDDTSVNEQPNEQENNDSNQDDNSNSEFTNTDLEQTDIRATIRGEGKTIIFTYDDEHRALKMQTAQAPSDTYMDEKGYMYSYNSKQGWVKINLGGMMNKLPMMSAFTGFGFEGMLETDTSNFYFPIIEWAMRFKTEAFGNNPNFKKQNENCGQPKPCSKFIGFRGQELGSYAIFDPSGKLKELNFKGNTINYEYGEYNIQLPNAKELSIFGM